MHTSTLHRTFTSACRICLLVIGVPAAALAQRATDSAGASEELLALAAELPGLGVSAPVSIEDTAQLCRVLRSRTDRQHFFEQQALRDLPAGLQREWATYTDSVQTLAALEAQLSQNEALIRRVLSSPAYDDIHHRVQSATQEFQKTNHVNVTCTVSGFEPIGGHRSDDAGPWLIREESADFSPSCAFSVNPAAEWGGGQLRWTVTAGGQTRGSGVLDVRGIDGELLTIPPFSLPVTSADRPVDCVLSLSLTPASRDRASVQAIESLRVLLRRDRPAETRESRDRQRLDSMVASIVEGRAQLGTAEIRRLASLYIDDKTSPEVRQDILWNLDAASAPSSANPNTSRRLRTPLRSDAEAPRRAGANNPLQLLEAIWRYKASRLNLAGPSLASVPAGASVAITNPPLSGRDAVGGQAMVARFGQVIELCKSADGWLAVVLTQNAQAQYDAAVVSGSSPGSLQLPPCPPNTPSLIAIDVGITGADVDALIRNTRASNAALVPSSAYRGTPGWEPDHILLSMFWCTRDQIQSISTTSIRFKGAAAAQRIGAP